MKIPLVAACLGLAYMAAEEDSELEAAIGRLISEHIPEAEHLDEFWEPLPAAVDRESFIAYLRSLEP